MTTTMNLIPTLAQQPGPSIRRCILGWLTRVANRHPLYRWYENKAILLDHYGEDDGFDLQTVEATCFKCAGEGCFSCEYSGTHHTTRTVLKRRIVGTCVFHTPLRGWFPEEATDLTIDPLFRRHITGRIKHRPADHRAAREAIGWIMLLTGHYRRWWQQISLGCDWEIRTAAFPTSNPGFYPQHLIACGIALVSKRWKWFRVRCFDDIPF